MTTDVLTLAQLLSPSFPVGAFAYSHGLETAIAEGWVTDRDTLCDWIADLLERGSGRADAVLVAVALAAEQDAVPQIDATARAFAASRERLQETDLQGAAFCEAVDAVWGIGLGRLTYPVAIGRTAHAMALESELTVAMALQAFVGNLCAVAMRAVPLGQTDGQIVQTTLKPLCLSTAATVQGATLDDLYGCTFLSDIAAMRHETQYSRVFRT